MSNTFTPSAPFVPPKDLLKVLVPCTCGCDGIYHLVSKSKKFEYRVGRYGFWVETELFNGEVEEVSFEYVLDNSPEEVQEALLFHLDIFIGNKK